MTTGSDPLMRAALEAVDRCQFLAFRRGLDVARKVMIRRCQEHNQKEEAVMIAQEEIRRSVKVAEQSDDGSVAHLSSAGKLVSEFQDPEATLKSSDESAEQFLKAGDKVQAAAAILTTAAIYKSTDRMDDALRAVNEALKLSREAGDAHGEVSALNILIDVHLHRASGAEVAAKVAQEALAISKTIGKPQEAAALCTLSMVRAKAGKTAGAALAYRAAEEAKAIGRDLGDKRIEAAASSGILLAHLLNKSWSDAAKTLAEMLEVFRLLEDKAWEAKARSMLANVKILAGDGTDGLTTAKEAAQFCRANGLKADEEYALRAILSASYLADDVLVAVGAAKDLCKYGRTLKSVRAEGVAMIQVATAYMSTLDFVQALRVADEAQALGAEAKDVRVQVAALTIKCEGERGRGKPRAGQRAAEEALALARSTKIKALEGSALLLVVDANPSSPAAITASQEAITIFKELGSKVGEGAALIAATNAFLFQAEGQANDCLQAAQKAISVFKAAGEVLGEAVALSTLATVQMAMQNGVEAERTAAEAQKLFHTLGHESGVLQARTLVTSSRLSSLQPMNARLYLQSDAALAHIELNEMATQESLEAAISTVHNLYRTRHEKMPKTVVMHLEGAPGPSSLHCYALTSGAFAVGVRSIGLPVVLAVWGNVSGPSWSLFLTGDYRVAEASTMFHLPVCNPPSCMVDLLGQSVTTQLCMMTGTITAQHLLEMGVIQQVRKGKDEVEKAASEMAKRIAKWPPVGVRQTLNLMAPDANKYAIPSAKRDHLPPDPKMVKA